MSSISARIRDIRDSKGWSQTEIAEKMHISRPTYIAIENGKKQLTIGEAMKLSDILGVSVDAIMFGKNNDAVKSSDENTEKYRQVLLSCLEYGSDDGDKKITKTKLAKMIYLIDFNWYYEHRSSMTGMQYRCIQQGPVPDIYFRIIDELFENGVITIEQRGMAMMISANESAPINRLNNEENDLIKQICSKWKDKNTQEIVDFTHNQKPWKFSQKGEIIPYELILDEKEDNLA